MSPSVLLDPSMPSTVTETPTLVPVGETAASSERVILYVRPGCHLCEPATDVVRARGLEAGVGWRVVDVEADAPDAVASARSGLR